MPREFEVTADMREALKMKPDSFKVSGDGIFYTLQGEGTSMGKPAVFLRLHFCNLQCGWCDTPYTWKTENKAFWTESQNWTIPETKGKVEGAWACANDKVQKRLIITGGEPLLQKDKIDKLLDQMPDWKVEIETNGTQMPTQKQLERCQFNCSPKLANSDNSLALRVKPEVIRTLAQADTTFKFVVQKPEELDEIEHDYIEKAGIDPNKVILMPEGRSTEELMEHAKAVAEYAKEKGYRLLSRLQVEVWGNARRT